jgi:type IV pilus assembly protein PilB
MAENKRKILAIDDDADLLALIQTFLKRPDWEVKVTAIAEDGLAIAKEWNPDIILLDITMPRIDGYEVAKRLSENSETDNIPIVFVTAANEERKKLKAFSLGAVDYLTKPFVKGKLIEVVEKHIGTRELLSSQRMGDLNVPASTTTSELDKFFKFLKTKKEFDENLVKAITPVELYSRTEGFISSQDLSKHIAEYFRYPYLNLLNPYEIKLGFFTPSFSKRNLVVAMESQDGKTQMVLSNPFNLYLMDIINEYKNSGVTVAISDPQHIRDMLNFSPYTSDAKVTPIDTKKEFQYVVNYNIDTEVDTKDSSVLYMADRILTLATNKNASDIHIEPKEMETIVRFRIDGEMYNFFQVNKKLGNMIISRLKALSGMDIAQKRRPQDGSLSAVINKREFTLRFSTTSTPYGESLVIRLIEPREKAKTLQELGMTSNQESLLKRLTGRNSGLILFVGPTGSGKTTTVYSLLSALHNPKRSLVSVEDPIEYRIAFANQQQVNEKAGITFESLLKSSVRQDPDILFLGEMRDGASAKIAFDFASTAHLTISTLHTSNSTSALFRLERLGISRDVMADTILAIVAQKLVRKLCPVCKKFHPPTEAEAKIIFDFSKERLEKIGKHVGCENCSGTGYVGREGVFEILEFSPEVADLVRSGKSFMHIRTLLVNADRFLMANHAISKLKEGISSFEDVNSKIFADEMIVESAEGKPIQTSSEQEGSKRGKKHVLIVEDDKDTAALIGTMLDKGEYGSSVSYDGVEALIEIGKNDFDLIIADITMPNMDGFKLVEMLALKGIKIPVVFLTASEKEGDEVKALELGVEKYIKKPVKEEILLLTVKNMLKK